MKILVVNSFFPPTTLGGAEESVKELVEELGSMGHDVLVVSLAASTEEAVLNVYPLYSHLKLRNSSAGYMIGNSHVRSPRLRKLLWHLKELARPLILVRLRRAVRRWEPDVVNLHNVAGFGVSAWLAVRNYPTVQTIRDYYLVCLSASTFVHGNCTKQCRSCTIAKASFRARAIRPLLYIGVSQALVDRVRDFGLPVRSSRIVLNRPKVARGQQIGCKHVSVIGYIGRIEEHKGVFLALQAFSQVQRSGLRFVVAGSGSSRAMGELYELISADSRIDFVGQVPKEEFYEQVDAVVVPSQWHEPFGRTVAEAARAGRAVAFSELGGLPEAMNVNGGVGVKVANYWQVDAWSSAIRRLVMGRFDTFAAATDGSVSVGEAYVRTFELALGATPHPPKG